MKSSISTDTILGIGSSSISSVIDTFWSEEEACSQFPLLSPDLDKAWKISSDSTQSLDVRLEAYEDVFDSEVGDTSISRARNIERKFGLRQLYFKFEGGNPTGTQKDRIAFAQAMDALRRGYRTITAATCGNYGVALAFAASGAGLKCSIFIPSNYHPKRLLEMEQKGAQIFSISGDYETAVDTSRTFAASSDDIYDANPGGTNTIIQLKAYSEIAYEIYDELRDAPAVVAVSVSNGTTLAGIHKGFVSLYRRGKISRIPRFVAGSSSLKNPIIRAFQKNYEKCFDLSPDKIRETSTNGPLVNWHSIDGDLALEAVRSTSGHAGDVSDKSMRSYSKIIREQEGLSVLPASTAGLVCLLDLHQTNSLPGDRYVAILTGRKD